MVNRTDLRDRFRTDYSKPFSRSARPTASATPTPPATRNSFSRVKFNKRRYAYLLAVGLVLAVGAVGWLYMDKLSNPIPSEIREKSNLALYYPERLPDGYLLDENSFKIDGQIVTFTALADDNRKIIFTLQGRPQTFDFQKFYQQGLSGTEQFTTPAGQAAIGKSPTQQLIGNLVGEKTWVIVSSSSPSLTASDLKLVLNGLKESN